MEGCLLTHAASLIRVAILDPIDAWMESLEKREKKKKTHTHTLSFIVCMYIYTRVCCTVSKYGL